jgi:hypothetical protein
VPDRNFSIEYGTGWTSDDAALAEDQDYYKSISVAGYTVAGQAMMRYVAPDGKCYLAVREVDSPLPVTVDRVTPAAPFDKMFPGFKEPANEWTEIDSMNAVGEFTCDEGRAIMLIHVKVAPPQVWYVVGMGDSDGSFDACKSVFDRAIATFETLD